jgi:molybdopterin molybdotransferase
MDGYAVAGDLAPKTQLPVSGTIAAGDPPGAHLDPGTALRIMTGAPCPRGADRIIPVELTSESDNRVTFHESLPLGAHIRHHGEVTRVGDEILPAGSRLTPGALSLAASHGYGELPVHGLPTVHTLATGDEVVPPEVEPGPGQLRDTHTDFLLAAGATLGLVFQPLGIARDQDNDLERLVAKGLRADVLILSGGVSMGRFDLVEGVLERLGCRVLFNRVAIQPGKPLVAAVHPGGLVFGLPGNPASVKATFWLFVRPVLRCLMGRSDHFWGGALKGTLAAPLPGARARDRFLAAEVHFQDGGILVTPHDPRGSHDLTAYARGTALVRIPAGADPSEPGESCEILPLADWTAQAGERT